MCYVQKLPGIAGVSIGDVFSMIECIMLFFETSPLLFLWNFFDETIYVDDFKPIKELREAIVSQPGPLPLQKVDRPSQIREHSDTVLTVIVRKRAQTELVTLNTADGQSEGSVTL